MAETFDPEQVAEFEHSVWSRCAKGYMEGFGVLVNEAITPLLDAAQVRRGSHVLDLGTGPGLVAAAALERGGTVVGIDFSEAMLVEARRRYPEIEFRQASAESLPFPDAQFDAVTGNFVLHHLGRPTRALEESARVLRKNGQIALTVWADPSKLEAFGLFFAAVAEHGSPRELPHGPLFGVSEFDVFHRMVQAAGFCNSSVKELPITWRMDSIDSLLAAFTAWAHMDALPVTVRAAIDGSIRGKAKGYEHGDLLIIPNPAILISASK